MACVQSLGIHQPIALQYLVEEDLINEESSQAWPSGGYRWDIISENRSAGDDEDNEDNDDDELVITRTSVTWARGCTFEKCFRFELEKEPVTHALLAYFPTSPHSQESSAPKTKQPRDASCSRPSNTRLSKQSLSKALVVFLKTQMHIFFLDGTSHIVNMPFEVEYACAAPTGIIIQRKFRMDNTTPMTLKLPRVPPNSFVSSQIMVSPTPTSHVPFSTEGLGKPKTLPIRLSTNVSQMWETRPESPWPRLVCLTDPLLDIGLVVTQADLSPGPKRRSSLKPSSHFLDDAEEILHVETIRAFRNAGSGVDRPDGLTIAVTCNRDANTYTVWKLTYLPQDEIPFARGLHKPAHSPRRRRSSYQPGTRSGTSTLIPALPSFRESFGAPMPGKRGPKKSERAEKLVDIASTIQADNDGGVARRKSSRLSSILARQDLATQDRVLIDGSKRVDSQSSRYTRHSSGFHSTTHSQSHSHLEPRIDDVFEDLRLGGNFEGLHTITLDDSHLQGLNHEIHFCKIHSVSIESSNLRYSLSTQPAIAQCRVFVMAGPPFTVDEQQRSQILIGIQDHPDKRLQLLTFSLHKQKKLSNGLESSSRAAESLVVSWSHLRKAQQVVDSCKIVDGDVSTILILSKGRSGHELSIQAPWSKLTPIELPTLVLHDTNSLISSTLDGDLDKESRCSKRGAGTLELSSSKVVALTKPTARGTVDVMDQDGTLHRIRIQLRPSSPFVRKMLDSCRSVLPPSHTELVLVGWWAVMQWLKEENAPFPEYEWSCFVVLILAMYLGLGLTESAALAQVPKRHLQGDIFASFCANRSSTMSNWSRMQLFETPSSATCPGWMQNPAWEWMLEEDKAGVLAPHEPSHADTTNFLSRHIVYAKQFLASPAGVEAIGPMGYLPTAVGRGKETRQSAAWAMFLALHAAMEEEKLNIMTPEYQSPGRADLRVLMHQIARWLKWNRFAALYQLGMQAEVDSSHENDLIVDPLIPEPTTPWCILDWVQSNLVHQTPTQFQTLSRIFYSGSMVSEIEQLRDTRWRSLTPRTLMFQSLFTKLSQLSISWQSVDTLQLVEAIFNCGFNNHILETLPEAILVPLRDAIAQAQPRPLHEWPRDLLAFINRSDISILLAAEETPRKPVVNVLAPTHTATWDYSILCKSVGEFSSVNHADDGSIERQAVIRALFKDDRRLDDAKALLNTSRPRGIRVPHYHTWSDSEYLEQLKEAVARTAITTLAIPAGRGLLYYGLRFPLLTQKYVIQSFNLNCIVYPNKTTVGVDKATYTEDSASWAYFHQGVAGGLAISPKAKGIDTSWILYNKPDQDLSHRHAGFLLALGLNGHLKSVAKWVAFKYLTPKHTMTSIGLLLGLAASYLGTMDSLITRLLSVHVTRMLPRGSAELNLSPLTQTTGILGIGLLYANTQHKRMSEIMASEISYPDPDDEEEPLRSESYRLAAGYALGLINLARGQLFGTTEMKIVEHLLALASGTKKVENVQVLDRAAAAATMAIALIYMRTENQIVARKVDVPDTTVQFDYVRPDVLLLRTVAKNIIMWSRIKPTPKWIRKSLPAEFESRYRLNSIEKLSSADLSFYAILAGICFALALRFAGSARIRVRDLLIYYLDQFRRISQLPADGFDARLTKSGVVMALDTITSATAIVMAGTGDVTVFRRLRALHGRMDFHLPYGTHLATHLATGALFLGSGTKTFGTFPLATASLMMAFYPAWPVQITDNRSHLQAARHFWTLAVEDRCLVTREIDGGVVSVSVIIKLKNTEHDDVAYEHVNCNDRAAGSAASAMPRRSPRKAARAVNRENILRLTTPALLPPLEQIACIHTVAAPMFWNLSLDFEKDPELRTRFAAGGMNMYLRRRPGHESVLEGTIQALASKPKSVPIGAADPLEWIFELDSLAGLTAMERNAVLRSGRDYHGGASTAGYGGGGGGDDSFGGGGGGGGLAQAVDVRLELMQAARGHSREDLLGLKMLFAWEAERADRLKRRRDKTADDAKVASHAHLDADEVTTGHPVADAEADTAGSSSDVVMRDVLEDDQRDELEQQYPQQQQHPMGKPLEHEMAADEEADWWLRSTVVDEIKGRVFLRGHI